MGDAGSYLSPIDNYIKYGEYFYNSGEYFYDNTKTKQYMGRAPYYGIIYYFFRIFFTPSISYELLGILQICLEALSIMYLSLLAFNIGKRKIAFLITYLISLISLNVTYYSPILMTESLTISFLIFSVYFFYKRLANNNKIYYLWLSSIFFSIVVALKPYFGLIYIFWVIFEFVRNKKSKMFVQFVLIISVPYIVLILPYLARNLIRFKTFQPFPDYYGGYAYSKPYLAYWDFLKSWGGSKAFWYEYAAACYFENPSSCKFTINDIKICNIDKLKDDIIQTREVFLDYLKNRRLNHEKFLIEKFSYLTETIKKDCPFTYYIKSRLIYLKRFLFHSGSYYLPIYPKYSCFKEYQISIKLSQSFLYWFTLIFGIIGLISLYKLNPLNSVLMIFVLYLILFFPLGIKADEIRYFVHSYPFLTIGGTYWIIKFVDRLTKINYRKDV